MTSLERTYQFLESTSNQASLQVLVSVLSTTQDEIRSRAITAVLRRESVAGCEALVGLWHRLSIEDRMLLMDSGETLCEAVKAALRSGEETSLLNALDITLTLGLHPLLPQLILHAESNRSATVRTAALKVVTQMAAEQGAAARADRERPAIRKPLLRALSLSVGRYANHRSMALVDAMLAASKRTDSDLLSMLSDGSAAQALILERFQKSRESGVLELLAGMIHRPRLCVKVEAIIAARSDTAFREQLLEAVGLNPNVTVLRNLTAMGLPACCRLPQAKFQHLSQRHFCAMAIVHAACDRDTPRCLTMLLDALESLIRNVPEVSSDNSMYAGLKQAFSRCPPLNGERLLRAAASVSRKPADVTEDEARPFVAREPDVRLLERLLRILPQADASLATPIRAILSPLTALAVLPRFPEIRPATRRRIGRIVLQVDPQAVQTVADQLRHPLLQRRVEAIQGAVAFNAVDQLLACLLQIVKHDHLEARRQAIEALGSGRGADSYAALAELVNRSEGSLRETAAQSFQRRASPS